MSTMPILSVALGSLLVATFLPLCARLIRGTPIHPLEPLWPFLVAYAITFVLKPLLDGRGFATYEWFSFEPASATRAVAVATGALLILYAGYLSGGHRLFSGLLPALRHEPSAARTRGAAAVLLGAGAAAIWAILRTAHVPLTIGSAVAGDYRAEILRASYGHGYLTILYACASFAPAMQIATALRTRRAVDWLLCAVMGAGVGAMLTVVYSRQLLLQAVIVMLVVLHFRGRLFSRVAIVMAGVAIVFVGGFLGARRVDNSRVDPLAAFAFVGHTFDSFEFLTRAIDELPAAGRLGGRSFIEDVTLTYLPRSMFPDKPDEFGAVRVQNLVAPSLSINAISSSTYPPGFLVEGYANFGYAGIAMIALAYGIGLRLALEWFWPRRQQVFALLVHGGFALNVTGMFRSATQFAMGSIVVGMLLYIALYARIPIVVFERGSAAAELS
jgi:hypothetical protein